MTRPGRSLILAAMLLGSPGPGPAPAGPPERGPVPHLVDRFGDPLPDGAVARLGTTRFRAYRPFCVCFAPDGKALLSDGGDGTVRLWDPATGKELGRLQGPHESVSRIAVSADGRVLAMAGHDPAVRLWDLPARRELHVLRGHDGPVYGVAVSPDGKLAASLGSDRTVRVWDAVTGREVARPTLPARTGTHVRAIAFAPDGKLLAATSPDKTVALWRAPSWEPAGTLAGHTERVVDLAFAPDGKRLYSGGDDGWVREWDLATGQETRRFGDGKSQVGCVAVASDGRSLVFGAGRREDGSRMRLWDLGTGTETRAWVVAPTGATSAAFSPDGRTLATAGWSVRLWDPATGRRLDPAGEAERPVHVMAFSPDGSRLATGTEEPTIRVWDTTSWKLASRVEGSGGSIQALAFTPDGKGLATVEASRAGREPKSDLRIRDAATGKPVQEFPTGGIWIGGPLAFAPAGDVLVVQCRGEFILWDPATGKERGRIKNTEGNAGRLAITADGRTLVAAGGHRAVTRWGLPDGGTPRTFGPDSRWFAGHAIAADGRAVAWAPQGPDPRSRGGDFTVWDSATGRERRVPARPYPVNATALSPDGRLLAVAGRWDREIRVWDVTAGTMATRFWDPYGPVHLLAFSPDGRRLASAGLDGTVLVWDCTAPPAALPARPPAGDLAAAEWDQLWTRLASRNELEAYPAVRELVRRPDRAAPFLRERLDAHPLRAAGGVARLVAELGDEQFAVRERAARQLDRFGPAVEPDLRRALAGGKLSAEAAERARRLVDAIRARGEGPTPEEVHLGWAVEALELMGTPAARAALEHLAGGGWGADEAKAALGRLAKEPRPAR